MGRRRLMTVEIVLADAEADAVAVARRGARPRPGLTAPEAGGRARGQAAGAAPAQVGRPTCPAGLPWPPRRGRRRGSGRRRTPSRTRRFPRPHRVARAGPGRRPTRRPRTRRPRPSPTGRTSTSASAPSGPRDVVVLAVGAAPVTEQAHRLVHEERCGPDGGRGDRRPASRRATEEGEPGRGEDHGLEKFAKWDNRRSGTSRTGVDIRATAV